MNFRNTMIGMFAIVSLVACSKSEEKKSGAAALGAPAAVDGQNIAGNYEAGTPNFIFGASGSQVSVDGQVVQHVDDATFTGYPMLSSQVSDLSSITKVINTKENALELWAGESLLLAFDLRSSTPALLHSGKGGFRAEHVTFAMSEAEKGQKQGMSTATLTIDMRECMAEQKQEEQKPVDQGKVTPIDQGKKPLDQGKHLFSAVAAVEGEDLGGQGQAKEQEKPMEQGKPAEICKLVSMVWHLAEIEQPKQQDQGKEPVDQGKVTPIDQGKATPEPVDQGKQGQDQGKVTPIDQGKATPEPVDQGKATPKPVDQGKATPEPVDQGKATPEPVDQGKVAPIDQAKEQGKEPAPFEQGKEQGQDQAKK